MFEKIIWFLRLLFDPPAFIVDIRDGQAMMTRGKVCKPFLDECTVLCLDNNIRAGTLYGVKSENGIRLEFSGNIPENFQQRFRNLWGIYK